MSTRAQIRRQRGVTLVELIMFMVIISIALAGIIGVMNWSTSKSADPLRRKQALLIAEGLLEEVRLAAFTWCDPSSDSEDLPGSVASAANCKRPEAYGNEGPAGAVFLRPFDNINDYVSAPKVAEAAFDIKGVLSDAAGQPIEVSGYTARLTLEAEDLNGITALPPASNNPADVDVLRIRVEVGYGGDAPVVLDAYRTRYAPEAR
jgi:MSHA pilin protein MshD